MNLHDITEILLKVVLNTIMLTLTHLYLTYVFTTYLIYRCPCSVIIIASHWETLSYKIVSSTPHHEWPYKHWWIGKEVGFCWYLPFSYSMEKRYWIIFSVHVCDNNVTSKTGSMHVKLSMTWPEKCNVLVQVTII
jgi:hypothetical protein